MLELRLSLTASHRCLPRPGAPGWWLGICQAGQAPKQAALEGPLSCGHSFWVVLSSLWMIIGLLRHKDRHLKDRLGKDQNKAGIKTRIKQLNKELSGNRLDRFNADSGWSKRKQEQHSSSSAAAQSGCYPKYRAQMVLCPMSVQCVVRVQRTVHARYTAIHQTGFLYVKFRWPTSKQPLWTGSKHKEFKELEGSETNGNFSIRS